MHKPLRKGSAKPARVSKRGKVLARAMKLALQAGPRQRFPSVSWQQQKGRTNPNQAARQAIGRVAGRP